MYILGTHTSGPPVTGLLKCPNTERVRNRVSWKVSVFYLIFQIFAFDYAVGRVSFISLKKKDYMWNTDTWFRLYDKRNWMIPYFRMLWKNQHLMFLGLWAMVNPLFLSLNMLWKWKKKKNEEKKSTRMSKSVKCEDLTEIPCSHPLY